MAYCKNTPITTQDKTMKIVKIQGGLGNQMFQYAFARSLEHHGHCVSLDTSLYDKIIVRGGINYCHNGFELAHLFDVKFNIADSDMVKKIATIPNNLINRIRRKYFTKKTHYIDKVFKYTPEILDNQENTYLEGYWQSEKYFENITDLIRTELRFKLPLSKPSLQLFEETQLNENANIYTSIHVRRGDYLKGKTHAVCTETYYNNAISHVLKNSSTSRFLVFSNDIPWCKTQLNFQDVPAIFVDWNTGIDSWQDMAIMSRCQINIIANSSFSWWAAWLNTNEDKKIIAPAIWNRRELEYNDPYYKFDYSDIVPKSWARIPI